MASEVDGRRGNGESFSCLKLSCGGEEGGQPDGTARSEEGGFVCVCGGVVDCFPFVVS